MCAEPEFQTLALTPSAAEILYRGKQLQMKMEIEPEEIIPISKNTVLSDTENDLFDILKELRGKLAKEAGIPAYVVFSNATLADMARKKPKTMSEFRKVNGVGEIKAQWYASAFLKCIQKYRNENE